MSTAHPLRSSESEKITLNLGPVDLGRIDLMVQEGYYANRADFIRTAIRNQLGAEGHALRQSIERHMMEVGLRDVTRTELEAARNKGEVLHYRVIGLIRFANDIPPELARQTVGSVTVLGQLVANKEIRTALADRTA